MNALKTFAACAVCAFASLNAGAATIPVGGYTWTYQLNGSEATISKGSMSMAISPNPTGDVTVPPSLAGYSVTCIGYGAFYNAGLTGVTIPSSVTSLSYGAFYGCASLKQTGLTSSTEVTSVGDSAYRGCVSLTSVNIPAKVLSVGVGTFAACTGIKTLQVGSGIKTIPASFASGCSSLLNLTIGSNVQTIETLAFKDCSSLETVVLPLSLTSLASQSFKNCSKLKTVYAPIALKATIEASKDDIFSGCPSTLGIVYYGRYTTGGKTWNYYVNSAGGAVISNDPTLFSSSAAALPKPSGALTIPSSLNGYTVTEIEWGAFAECTDMTSVTIPDDVAFIGYGAFSYCSKLASASLPKAMLAKAQSGEFTEGDAFYDCADGLVVLYRQSSTVSAQIIGGVTWYFIIDGSTASLVSPGSSAPCISPAPTGSLTVPAKLGGKTVAVIGDSAFNKCGELTSISFLSTASIRRIGEFAFNACKKLSAFSVPAGVTDIGQYAFKDCDALTTMTIPNAVANLGKGALYDCNSLKTLTIGIGVMAIPDDFAYYCTSLETLNIGANVTSIGEKAFGVCNKLEEVLIPSGVTSIANGAFAYCGNLTRAKLPESLRGVVDESNVFRDCPSYLHVLYYASTGAYTEVFGGYTWYFIVTGINEATIYNNGDCAISPAPSSGTLIFPNTLGGYPVTGIGENAFANCTKMECVQLPDALVSIGGYAFSHCYKLSGAPLPSGLLWIGDCAFENCSKLGVIDIPGSVTSIGANAFQYSGLYSAMIGGGLETIKACTFYGCSHLDTLTIPKNVTAMGAEAFFGTALSTVKVDYGDTDRIDALIKGTGYNTTGITYEEGERPAYTILFHRYDSSSEKTAAYDFDYGVSTHLPSLNSLGWARRGFDFQGWATSKANADAGKVWKKDWAIVSTAAEPGKTLSVYAVWALKSDSYAIQFIRNDGAGTWRTVGFTYGEKTRMPSVANGLKWARRGYDFKGWALTTADANAGKIWKGDWAYVSTPVKAGEVLTVYAVWALKPGFYQIRFNKNDGSGKWRTLGFEYGVSTKLPSIDALGWARQGHSFDFWASSKANADAGRMWRYGNATVATAAAEGKTLSVYAVWDYNWPWEGGPSSD